MMEKMEEIERLKEENRKAQEIMYELERQTEYEQEEFAQMQAVADQERRQTASAQDAAARKIRSLQQEK